ncbi:hypothetical protein B0H14DRAFT_3623555 [Mycena olivaceomarginata]|nr:hypothetical protein B0H14DRAFT_3623555 [Mycena olivaceomarginata]
MSNAPYDVLGPRASFEPTTFLNWLDPRSLPAYKRTYLARSWMLKGPRGEGAVSVGRYPRCARLPSQRHFKPYLFCADANTHLVTHATFCSVDPPSPLNSPACTTLVQSSVPPACTACAADIPHHLRCAHRIQPPRRAFPAVPPPDTRASCIQHKDNGSTRPRRLRALYALTASILSATTRPAKSARAHERQCSYAVRGNEDPAVLPLRAARRLRLPFRNADPPQAREGERGEGLLTAGLLVRCGFRRI